MSVHDPSGAGNHTDTGRSESGPRNEMLAIESCAFTWLFDLPRRRFRRVPTGAALDVPVRPTAWTDYHSLRIDADRAAFSLSLNAEATRVLRSSYHLGLCVFCGLAGGPGSNHQPRPAENPSVLDRQSGARASQAGITEGTDHAEL